MVIALKLIFYLCFAWLTLIAFIAVIAMAISVWRQHKRLLSPTLKHGTVRLRLCLWAYD
jgi:hypothetical protein